MEAFIVYGFGVVSVVVAIIAVLSLVVWPK